MNIKHQLIRVWNEGALANFTYAYRCSCGAVDRDYITEDHARDAWRREHTEQETEQGSEQ